MTEINFSIVGILILGYFIMSLINVLLLKYCVKEKTDGAAVVAAVLPIFNLLFPIVFVIIIIIDKISLGKLINWINRGKY